MVDGKGPKHEMRLKTVRGYCVNKYTASLPLTSTHTPSRLSEMETPYECLQKKRKQEQPKDVPVILPRIHYID